MKSERRHELQHNALADAIGDWTVRLRPYSRMITGLLVLAVAVGIAVAWVSGSGQQKVAAGWDEYFDAVNNLDRARLTEVAEKYAGTSVAPWARVVAADLALNEGITQLFSNKTQGRELLRQAVDNYQTIANRGDGHKLEQRALYGLGRAHESLAGVEDLEKARDDYQQLLEGWPSGIYAEAAKQRLADLQQTPTKKFYDWFAKYEPPKTASPSGKQPQFLEESLDKTDVDLPSALDDLKVDGPKINVDTGPDEVELPGAESNQATPTDPEATEPETTEAESAAPKSEQPDSAEKPADEQTAPSTESPRPDGESPPASEASQ